jgi:hypothetical protein
MNLKVDLPASPGPALLIDRGRGRQGDPSILLRKKAIKLIFSHLFPYISQKILAK